MAVMVEELDLATLRRRSPVPFRKLEIDQAFNTVGSFTLELPATPRSWSLIRLDASGNLLPLALAVDWNGVASFSLHAEEWGYQRVRDSQTGRNAEVLTLVGSDMLGLLANRVAYLDPGKTWAQQPDTARTYTGPAETVIKQILTENVLHAPDAARRIPFLDIAPDRARGGTVTYKVAPARPASASSEPGDAPTVSASLMDMVRAVAVQSRIGVRLEVTGGRLLLDTYLPRDRSSRAVFSGTLGNLAQANLVVADPTATTVLSQNAGSRFSEVGGSGHNDPWRRVETVLDQTFTEEAADAAKAAEQALAHGAAAIKLAVTAIDLPRLRFGADAEGVTGYQVGDVVAVDIRDGVTFTDIVGKVRLVADATGENYQETVTPTIGLDAADDQTLPAQLSARLRTVEKRLRATAP